MTETSKNSPKVSMIVPVYNSEQYLPKCIDSILSQTYNDFELILVNDGSNDESGYICDLYAKQDNRVKVFHKDNGGVSSARNLGLDNATGEWISFIDSDDWVSISYLNNFINDIDDNTNFIMHGRYAVNPDVEEKNTVTIINISNKNSLFEELKISPNGQPWSKLFKNSIIKDNNLRFNQNISLSEDTLFILKYVSLIEEVKYRSIYNYNYEHVDESLSCTSKVDYNSNLIGFKTINNILYNDHHLKSLKQFPTLRVTFFAFFSRAIKALCVNGYSKAERLKGYKEIKDLFLFSFNTNEYSSNKIKQIAFYMFKKNHYKLFDLIMYNSYNRGKISSLVYSVYKKQKSK